jgi:hypothetical protein
MPPKSAPIVALVTTETPHAGLQFLNTWRRRSSRRRSTLGLDFCKQFSDDVSLAREIAASFVVLAFPTPPEHHAEPRRALLPVLARVRFYSALAQWGFGRTNDRHHVFGFLYVFGRWLTKCADRGSFWNPQLLWFLAVATSPFTTRLDFERIFVVFIAFFGLFNLFVRPLLLPQSAIEHPEERLEA